MRRRGAAAGALLFLAACGSGQWREVDARLRHASEPARKAGLVPLPGRNNEFGAFTDSGSVRWTLTLQAGRAYYLAAVCTASCRGLDLSMMLPDGTVLGRDSGGGAQATIGLQSPVSGDHPVRLVLAGCADGTCRWASQLYTQPD